MVSERKVQDQNPWWADPTSVERDFHLERFKASPFHWDPPTLTDIPLRPGDLSTLRGPRQVGKTTLLKRMIQRLIAQGEKRVLFYSFDTERSNEAIADVVRLAKNLSGQPPGEWYIFLDEVTSIPEWQRGIKYTWDTGLLRNDFVLCTGSSARRMGTEQLPGRRGKGRNYLQLTVSFRDFCRLVQGIKLPEETLAIEECFTPSGRELLKKTYLHSSALYAAFGLYSQVGGFPAAIADHVSTHRVARETISTVWSLVTHEIQQAGLDPTAALKLIERVGISLGSPLSWQTAADAMGMGSHSTAQEYARALAESFVLMTVYHWDMGGGFEPRKQRKLYLIDPLLGRIAPTLVPGSRQPNEDGLVEALVGVGLFRSASAHITQSEGTLGALGYWRSKDGREIDFVMPQSSLNERAGRVPVEVKGDAASEIKAAVSSIKQSFGRGIIATRTVFDVEGDVLRIPVAVLLAALNECTERRLSLL